MNKVLTLYRKELRGYFNSPIAYIVISVLLFGIGYFFFQSLFLGQQASMRPFFRFAAWSFVLFGPAVTMKLFAEEKKTGTLEPLMTLPVKEFEVVLGKFFAAWTLLAVYLVLTFAYPISISFIGDLDFGPLFGGYLGLFTLGGTFLALGILASTISKNQVVSLIIAFGIGLALFLLDMLLPLIPESLQNLVQFIGADSHFQNIARGVIDTRDLIYSISAMAIFLFLAVQVLQAKQSDHSKQRKLNKALYIGAAIGCLISLNIFSDAAYGRIDLTKDKRFTLNQASKKLVADLNDQVVVKAFFSDNLPAPFNNYRRLLEDKLEDYKNYSKGNLNYQFLNPNSKTSDGSVDQEVMALVNAAKIPKIPVQTLEKDQVQMVKVYMGLAIYYQDKMETMPFIQNIGSLEYELTSRISKLTREKTPKLGFLTGHGELSHEKDLTAAVSQLGGKYDVSAMDLSKDGAKLGTLDILVVPGPKGKLTESEVFQIDQFIMGGGKVAFFLDQNILDMQSFIGRPSQSGLEKLLNTYGAHIHPGVILDQANMAIGIMKNMGGLTVTQRMQYPPFIRVSDLAKGNPLVKNMSELPMLFVSPITLEDVDGVQAEVIAKSSPKTWMFENDDSFLVEPQMLPQPPSDESKFAGSKNVVVTLAGAFTSHYADKGIPYDETTNEPVAAGMQSEGPENRLVVVGSSLWLEDKRRNRVGSVFFANLVDWLAQDDALVGIRTRAIDDSPLEEVSPFARNLIKYGNMILLPLAFVALGLVRWQLRQGKKRRGTL